MNWTNVRLILAREIRDQLRDRRTLFMMAVLPILLYPLLGMSFLQISQFMHEHPVSVAVFGAENLPPSPRLIDGDHFAAPLFDSAEQVGLLRVTPAPGRGNQGKNAALEAAESGDYDAVVFIPPDFAGQLDRFHRLMTAARSRSRLPGGTTAVLPSDKAAVLPSGTAQDLLGRQDLLPAVEVPKPEIFWSKSSDKSQVASLRLEQVLEHWRREIVLGQPGGRGPSSGGGRAFPVAEDRRCRGDGPGDLALLAQAVAGDDAGLGLDRRLLPGRRPLCRREGAGHAGNPALAARRRGARSCWASWPPSCSSA